MNNLYERFLEVLKGPFREFVNAEAVNSYLQILGPPIAHKVVQEGVSHEFLVVSGYEPARGNWATASDGRLRLGEQTYPVHGLDPAPMVLTPNLFYGTNKWGQEIEYRLGLARSDEDFLLLPVILRKASGEIYGIALDDLCVIHQGLAFDASTAENLGGEMIEALVLEQQFVSCLWNIDDYLRKLNPLYQSDFEIEVWEAIEAFSGRIVSQMLYQIASLLFIDVSSPEALTNKNATPPEAWIIPEAEEVFWHHLIERIERGLLDTSIFRENQVLTYVVNLCDYMVRFKNYTPLAILHQKNLDITPFLIQALIVEYPAPPDSGSVNISLMVQYQNNAREIRENALAVLTFASGVHYLRPLPITALYPILLNEWYEDRIELPEIAKLKLELEMEEFFGLYMEIRKIELFPRNISYFDIDIMSEYLRMDPPRSHTEADLKRYEAEVREAEVNLRSFEKKHHDQLLNWLKGHRTDVLISLVRQIPNEWSHFTFLMLDLLKLALQQDPLIITHEDVLTLLKDVNYNVVALKLCVKHAPQLFDQAMIEAIAAIFQFTPEKDRRQFQDMSWVRALDLYGMVLQCAPQFINPTNLQKMLDAVFLQKEYYYSNVLGTTLRANTTALFKHHPHHRSLVYEYVERYLAHEQKTVRDFGGWLINPLARLTCFFMIFSRKGIIFH